MISKLSVVSGPGVAQPQGQQGAGHGGEEAGQHGGGGAVGDRAKTQRPSLEGLEGRAQPGGAHAFAGYRHAIGADAEEHGVGEADDAGVAQQQRRSQPAAVRQVVGKPPLIGSRW
jgi:hypothetical protein